MMLNLLVTALSNEVRDDLGSGYLVDVRFKDYSPQSNGRYYGTLGLIGLQCVSLFSVYFIDEFFICDESDGI